MWLVYYLKNCQIVLLFVVQKLISCSICKNHRCWFQKYPELLEDPVVSCSILMGKQHRQSASDSRFRICSALVQHSSHWLCIDSGFAYVASWAMWAVRVFLIVTVGGYQVPKKTCLHGGMLKNGVGWELKCCDHRFRGLWLQVLVVMTHDWLDCFLSIVISGRSFKASAIPLVVSYSHASGVSNSRPYSKDFQRLIH